MQPNLRPNPQFDDITFIESRASSKYDALQVKFQQRFDRGLSVLASYTYGKSTDDASGFFSSTGDPNFPQDSNNLAAERGRSSFDIRHRFSTSFSAELPWGTGRRWLGNSGVISTILENMELQGILTFNTGRPFTVALLPDFDNSNTGRSTLGFGANDRPNLNGDAKLDSPSADRWFNTAAFTVPAYGTFRQLRTEYPGRSWLPERQPWVCSSTLPFQVKYGCNSVPRRSIYSIIRISICPMPSWVLQRLAASCRQTVRDAVSSV